MTTEGLPPKEEIPLSRGRISSGRSSLLLPGLAVGGLLVLPAVGLVYAATTSFGLNETAPASSATALDDEGEPVKTAAKKAKTRKPVSAASSKARPKGEPRTDEAAECCAALQESVKTAPVEQRSIILSAIEACESATTPIVARRRVSTQLRSLRVKIPDACE